MVCSQNIQLLGGYQVYTFCQGRLQNRAHSHVNTQCCAVYPGEFFLADLLPFLEKMSVVH